MEGKGTNVDAIRVATGFVRHNVEYVQYNVKVCMQAAASTRALVSSWQPPLSPFVKVNVDAHVLQGNGVSFGCVIRDAHEVLQAAGVKRVSANWAPIMAEAGAARFGVEMARRLGFEWVMLECDALGVVRTIREHKEGAAPIFLFFDDIKELKSSFSCFDCVHVKRVGNTVAHSVARWEVDVDSELICTNSFPQSLQTLVALD